MNGSFNWILYFSCSVLLFQMLKPQYYEYKYLDTYNSNMVNNTRERTVCASLRRKS